jgi:regulator of nucleoside diphosphate kinase
MTSNDRLPMLPHIVLTQSDHRHLSLLVSLLQCGFGDNLLEFLDQEVARAALVDDRALGDRVAALGRRVLFRDNISTLKRRATLTCPGYRAQLFDGLSVLTPEGACLIGLSEGQSMQYWQANQIICDVTLCSVLDGFN